jgi:hypothetical protein
VIYDAHGTPHWSTHTSGGHKAPEGQQGKGGLAPESAKGHKAHAANDAQHSLADSSAVAPSSGASLPRDHKFFSPNRQFCAVFQGDGNLVVYKGAEALWSSESHGKGGARCVYQADGNLVIYGSGGQVVWAANTHGKGTGVRVLRMQDDGNLVAYGGDGTAVWSTGTEGGKKSAQQVTGRVA